MDRKKLYDFGKFLTKKLWQWERKVFLMTDSNKDFAKIKEAYLAQKMTPQQVQKLQEEIARAKKDSLRRKGLLYLRRVAATAAAVLAAVVILPNTSMGVAMAMEKIPLLGNLINVVTFRDYQYEDDKNNLNVTVPELVVSSQGTIGQEDLEAEPAGASVLLGEPVETLKKTTEEVNREIQEITEDLVAEFEENLEQEQGYQDITVQSEVLSTTADYFTLKLSCFQAMGSGAEWDYYYTIDLNTGKRITLKELFPEDCDYLTLISDDIKRQMREQMEADSNVSYWLDDEEIPEWNFQSITEETSFYLNQDGRLVICFNEGDVAPMYMGCVTFEISEEVYSR